MTNTENARRINVTVTAYEGDAFPEAEHYPEFVADRIASLYSAKVDCSEGQATRVFLYGFDDQGNTDLEDEIKSVVQVDLWEEFCAEGYKAFAS